MVVVIVHSNHSILRSQAETRTSTRIVPSGLSHRTNDGAACFSDSSTTAIPEAMGHGAREADLDLYEMAHMKANGDDDVMGV